MSASLNFFSFYLCVFVRELLLTPTENIYSLLGIVSMNQIKEKYPFGLLFSHFTLTKLGLQLILFSLSSSLLTGVTHNIPLLRDIMTEERFLKGNISTNYLPEVFPAGFKGEFEGHK